MADSISKRLKSVREAFHISQAELARRIGVSSQLISQIENSRIPLSYLTARAIESEFGVDHDWLITGIGEMVTKKKNASKETLLSPELITALDYYPSIAEALNTFAKRLTLSDWEAINNFLTREKESP